MPSEIISDALKRFKLAADAESEIRKKSLQDLKFRAGQQWPDEIIRMRNQAGNSRPCLVINRLPQFIRQVTNDQRMNRPSLKIDPTDDATVDTADIMEGLVRHIQVASNADIAFDTACDNQVTMGFGYFRLLTEYCDEMSFDQEIRIKRIKNAFSVYFDPFAVEPDYSDAKWAFIVSDMSLADFKATYKGKAKADYSDSSFVSLGDSAANWHSAETIRVAEYFTVEETPNKIYLMSDGTTVDKDGMEAGLAMGMQVLKERDSTKRKVIHRTITAFEELDKVDWAGKYIPIIPVLGDDLDIDGERELVGMVRYAQDPQRMYNYWASSQAETIALAPKSPFIIAEGQLEGYEQYWKSANTMPFSHLPYKPVSLNGTVLPPPHRQQAEPPVQAMVQAIAQASEDLKNTTGIYSAGLGKREGDASGIALKQLDKSGDVSNFHYIDNLSRAIRFLGIQLLDLIPKIYDAPRVVRILHEDGESELIKINQMFEKNGKQVNYDLSVGKYDVVVNTGPSFTTKRQEAVDSMIQMTQANPELWNVIGDIMVKNMDWPQAQEAAERLKKMLPPQLQEPEDGQQQIPPQVQQKMAQMQAMIEQLTQATNAAHDELDQKTRELESKERIAIENNTTQMIIAAMKQESANNLQLLQAELAHMNERMAMLRANQPIEDEAGEMPPPSAAQTSFQPSV
ncbi:hypothetical protein E6Q11_01125 [Candidatus Dojkabacteria bacterium]|uniref:Phage portal protein n=1 Tax=Candidatus Dojkabacteria bacterium TaxID=2099670 RepID=A0A5C7JA63_9BACT|nr:MAG: hypothetical protein E6Q11_01125 [Candidatus Dojkabacteria bacterium]